MKPNTKDEKHYTSSSSIIAVFEAASVKSAAVKSPPSLQSPVTVVTQQATAEAEEGRPSGGKGAFGVQEGSSCCPFSFLICYVSVLFLFGFSFIIFFLKSL